MNYKIKRCRICNQEIHIHNKKDRHGYTLKNTCDHIPNDNKKTFSEKELDQYIKSERIV